MVILGKDAGLKPFEQVRLASKCMNSCKTGFWLEDAFCEYIIEEDEVT